jgi:hypothetical protein
MAADETLGKQELTRLKNLLAKQKAMPLSDTEQKILARLQAKWNEFGSKPTANYSK